MQYDRLSEQQMGFLVESMKASDCCGTMSCCFCSLSQQQLTSFWITDAKPWQSLWLWFLKPCRLSIYTVYKQHDIWRAVASDMAFVCYCYLGLQYYNLLRKTGNHLVMFHISINQSINLFLTWPILAAHCFKVDHKVKRGCTVCTVKR